MYPTFVLIFEFASSTYINDQVTRHIVGARLGEELIFLMLQPLWSGAALKRRNVFHLESDFNRAILEASMMNDISGLRDSASQMSVVLECISRMHFQSCEALRCCMNGFSGIVLPAVFTLTGLQG